MPAEIRNEIYTLVFDADKELEFPRPGPESDAANEICTLFFNADKKLEFPRPCSESGAANKSSVTRLGICLASRQLHHEALPLFYQSIKMRIKMRGEWHAPPLAVVLSKTNRPLIVSAIVTGDMASRVALRRGMRGETFFNGMRRLQRVHVCTGYWKSMSDEMITRALRVFFQRPELEVTTVDVEREWEWLQMQL